MRASPPVSIVMPTYNGAEYLPEALASILSQSFGDFELIISDDCSVDATGELAASTADERIRFRRNERNLGYPGNLATALAEARGEVVVLFSQDDIFLEGALERTVTPFSRAPDVGLVTRPYYWFDDAVDRPIRAIRPPEPERDTVLSVHDGPRAMASIVESLGQLSGLAMRRSLMTTPCHPYVFTAHIAPALGILRQHQALYLGDVTVAVRAKSSQTRGHPEIYSPTPLSTWIRVGDDVFGDPAFADVRRQYRRVLGRTNHVGLVQLRNHAPFSILLDEMRLFVSLRPTNVFDPRFLWWGVCSLLVPRRLLRPATDWYKRTILGPVVRRAR